MVLLCLGGKTVIAFDLPVLVARIDLQLNGIAEIRPFYQQVDPAIIVGAVNLVFSVDSRA